MIQCWIRTFKQGYPHATVLILSAKRCFRLHNQTKGDTLIKEEEGRRLEQLYMMKMILFLYVAAKIARIDRAMHFPSQSVFTLMYGRELCSGNSISIFTLHENRKQTAFQFFPNLV